MHIDSYRFGSIEIDGKRYDADVIVFSGSVKARWWRAEDHRLQAADLEDVLAARPRVLVVGTGALGRMEIDGSARAELDARKIRLIEEKTGQAVSTFNALSREHPDTVGAFHLTC